MATDPDKIADTTIHSPERFIAHETLPFTVLRLNPSEELSIPWLYYLRTAPSVDEAIAKATKEFGRHGYKKKFDPAFSTGNISYQDNEVVILPDEKSLKGFNFVVPESLAFYWLRNQKQKVNAARTERMQTKRVYRASNHCSDLVESHPSLYDLVTDTRKPCIIRFFMQKRNKTNINEGLLGLVIGEYGIINCATLEDDYLYTVFKDPERSTKYQLFNGLWHMDNEELKVQPAKKRAICSTERVIFFYDERAKGTSEEKRDYIFDGTLVDVFAQLHELGIRRTNDLVMVRPQTAKANKEKLPSNL